MKRYKRVNHLKRKCLSQFLRKSKLQKFKKSCHKKKWKKYKKKWMIYKNK